MRVSAAPLLCVLAALVGCGSGRELSQDGDDEAGSETTTSTGTSGDSDTSSTSTTDTGGETESSDESGEDDLFMPEPDVTGMMMCDIWDQWACPEGEKCNAVSTMGSTWDASVCVPVMGDGQWLEPCMAFGDNPGYSGLDDCAKGLMCWSVDDNGAGYCAEWCKGAPDNPMCPDDGLCAIFSNGVLPLCWPKCDPLAPMSDCTEPTDLCTSHPGGDGFFCRKDESGGDGTYGTECQYVNNCNYGLFCANAEAVPNCQGSQGCCSEYCELGQPNTCAGKDQGQECVPWWEMGMAPPGYDHVGGCAIPE